MKPPDQKPTRSHARAKDGRQISFSIPVQDRELLKKTAARLDRPMSWVVRRLIRDYCQTIEAYSAAPIAAEPEGNTYSATPPAPRAVVTGSTASPAAPPKAANDS